MGTTRQPLPKTIRTTIIERDGKVCRLCGSDRNLTVDHIVAVSKGGTDDFNNLRTLCKRCNGLKGAASDPDPQSLRGLRFACNLDLATVANLSGIQAPTLFRWEQGRGQMPARAVLPLADLYGVDCSVILALPEVKGNRRFKKPPHKP